MNPAASLYSTTEKHSETVRHGTLVDIGGGNGSLLGGVLRKYP